MKPTLGERLATYFQNLLPTKRVTIYNDRNTPRVIAGTMDVDRVHSIVEGAIDGDTRELFALYREIILTDNHLQNELGKRKLAVLGDTLSIQPRDKKILEDTAAAADITAMVDRCETWDDALIFLLDSTITPVAVVEKVFRPAADPSLRYELAELVPVSDQLLDYTTGTLRIRDTDPNGNILAGTHEADPARYIIHRGHMLTTADNRGGPMRSVIFWWLLGSMSRDWWARFLDKYGSPFLLGKYDQADDASRSVLQQAFQWAVRVGGIVVSKQTEVEVIQAAASQSGDAYEKFLTICQREKSKLVIGQTLSSESQPLGIGGGAAGTQENVRQDIRQWDAKRLGQTLARQLFRQFLQINGRPGRTPKAIWGGESPEAAVQTGTLLAAMKQAGLVLTDEGITNISERFGMPFQRDAAAALPLPLPLTGRMKLLSAPGPILAADHANDAIARAGAAELAQAFRGALAPVRQMIEESTSAEDLQARLFASYADWPAGRVAAILESALVAYAANRLSLP